jgi:CRISPR-associated protein Cas2
LKAVPTNHTANNKPTLACHDITSDKLRHKIDKTMQDFGQRLQYSVFLCRLDANGIARMTESLNKVLERYSGDLAASDSLIIFEMLPPGSTDVLAGDRIGEKPHAFAII